jgi:hypothetical protein
VRGATLLAAFAAAAAGGNVSCLASNQPTDAGAQQKQDVTDQSADAEPSDSGDALRDTKSPVDSTSGDGPLGNDGGGGPDDGGAECVAFAGACTAEGKPCCRNLVCSVHGCIYMTK